MNILLPLLSEGQAGNVWESSDKATLFRRLRSAGQYCLFSAVSFKRPMNGPSHCDDVFGLRMQVAATSAVVHCVAARRVFVGQDDTMHKKTRDLRTVRQVFGLRPEVRRQGDMNTISGRCSCECEGVLISS